MSIQLGTIDLPYTAESGRAADAAVMTKTASRQTYYTIRLLADRDRRADAYRAYAYFRWVDDVIDDEAGATADKIAFVNRQRRLLEAGYRAAAGGGPFPGDLCPEERLLMELIAGDDEMDSGLGVYLRQMMAVMAFDVGRRGRVVSAAELDDYSRALATAVMAALLYFIGHCDLTPGGAARYAAVYGAHVVHMLRDTIEDTAAGYFNVPDDYLRAHGIALGDTDHPAYRQWVQDRIALARDCFRQGRAYIAGLDNPRRRLAGYAYVARFEWLARAIERDGYRLRAAYPERKSLSAGLWMAWRTVTSLL